MPITPIVGLHAGFVDFANPWTLYKEASLIQEFVPIGGVAMMIGSNYFFVGTFQRDDVVSHQDHGICLAMTTEARH